MNWTCRFSKEAAKQLRKLPQNHQHQLSQALQKMKKDPFAGDVRPIRSGKFRGALRKRVGRYRIIFSLDYEGQLIDIAAILIRSEQTYR
jgi:mRNA-degrading endonuclease RelE of RelBE toxin-antitoxin system